ncbi:MAG: hypothetical protein HY078_12925 [Elusimicrobia bacterium]|nr:hypothetical protein [Elusimicrobiota bacterium]
MASIRPAIILGAALCLAAFGARPATAQFRKPDPEAAAAKKKAAEEKAAAEAKARQFERLVKRYQRNNNDTYTLAKIMTTASSMDPKPSIPADAERLFARANAIMKKAKTPKESEKAVPLYEQALQIAPWWPEAYFNIAVAFEAAKRFDDAGGAFSLYLMTKPEEKDAAEAKRRMDALAGKKERAARELTPEEIERRKNVSIAGDWISPSAPDKGVQLRFKYVDDGWTMEEPARSADNFSVVKANRKEIQFDRVPIIYEIRHGEPVPKRARKGGWHVHCTLSDDGYRLHCSAKVFGDSEGLSSGTDEYVRSE